MMGSSNKKPEDLIDIAKRKIINKKLIKKLIRDTESEIIKINLILTIKSIEERNTFKPYVGDEYQSLRDREIFLQKLLSNLKNY